MASDQLTVAMNRVEGDLEVKVSMENGVVTDAWCVGTMYRGFEQILVGRDATDSLVLTPRVCGICGTAHLYCAVQALEMAMNLTPPPGATLIRDVCLAAEEVQSDLRHTFLMFTPDLCHPSYSTLAEYEQVIELFAPYKGRIYREVLQYTKEILKVVAIFGGQWPHASYMMPGGITWSSNKKDIIKAINLVDETLSWVKSNIFGSDYEKWLSLESEKEMLEWSESNDSPIALFIRFCRRAMIHQLGTGKSDLLSYGSGFDPEKWQAPFKNRPCDRTPGIFSIARKELLPLDTAVISEDITYSWFTGSASARHPSQGETNPAYAPNSEKYSWCKAPRYDGRVLETGPLAETVCAGDPLFKSMVLNHGTNSFLRQLVRLHRPLKSLISMRDRLQRVLGLMKPSDFFVPPEQTAVNGEGYGLVQAARGSLGHWVSFKEGKIERYQIITPTAWNASPRDGQGIRGHWEESLIGAPLPDPKDPLKLGHIIRSHDACLVCTVHVMKFDEKHSFRV